MKGEPLDLSEWNWAGEEPGPDAECPYCGQCPAEGRWTADHMDPLTLGGADARRNIVWVCRSCNSRKGTLSFIAWLERLPANRRAAARERYVAQHGHEPEAFLPDVIEIRLSSDTREVRALLKEKLGVEPSDADQEEKEKK